MTQIPLYRYPFDDEGRQILTFAESLAAMRELERQLSTMLPTDWRWCDLRLSVVERHPTYVVYDVQHHDRMMGRAVVMPYSAEPPKIEPESALDEDALREKIRARRRSEGA